MTSRVAVRVFLILTAAGVLHAADDPVSFKTHVAPTLVRKCLSCHGDKKAAGGLNLKTFALLIKGGKTYQADILVAGDPDASALYTMLQKDAEPRMPYKLAPLSTSEIKTIARWIQQGAKFDGPSESETPLASLVEPLSGLPAVAVKTPAADPVAALAFSPDGKTLAAGQGRAVHLFETATNKRLKTLGDHPGPVTAVRFSPDGKTLYAVGGRPGQFGSIIAWDLEKQTKRFDLHGHADAILAAALSPDGKTLATAGYDRLMILWDLDAARPIRELKEHTDSIHGVSFSHDGASLASASADRTIKVWDVATGRRRVTLSDATAEQYAARFSPDGKTVYGGGVDRTLRAWTLDGDSSKLAKSAIAHDGAILRLIVAPAQNLLYSCGEDQAIKLWDLTTLAPKAALPAQPDWPLDFALSPDGKHLAIGRYDGGLALVDPTSGKQLVALLEPPTPPKPELVRNATLAAPQPRGAARGDKLRVTLNGNGIGRADLVRFPEPGITATLVPPEKPNPNTIQVDLKIADNARVGVHRFLVRTPLGTPAAQRFAVSPFTEITHKDSDAEPPAVALPATLVGTIDKPGDTDAFRFEAAPGRTLVFETLARELGSTLNGTLTITDAHGAILAEAQDSSDGLDPILAFDPPIEGTYILNITDADFGGSANHFYRVNAGVTPRVADVFPLGVERGRTASIQPTGPNLKAVNPVALPVAATAAPGSLLSVPVTLEDGSKPFATRNVVVAAGPQRVENDEPNDQPAEAAAIGSPGGLSGRIDRAGDVDYVRFPARKHQRVIVEVFARRLGSPLDPTIDVLDAKGLPIPRAVLRPVAETNVAFRDHVSSGRNIRLTVWNDLAMKDYVLIGRELLRITELPRNPDDDAVFWGLGIARTAPGERIGFLETTPEQHPLGQPIRKVEIHPPGTTFPLGGAAPVPIYYRNDDGGPGFRGDARVTFDPPADGDYLVRVEDARGQGEPASGYHIVVRPPNPDFQLSLDTENPNVPRGGTAVLMASLQRIDGFEGPVELAIEGLPEGITATTSRIEPGFHAAEILLQAADDAPDFSANDWKIVAKGLLDPTSSGGPELRHELDPGGPSGGWITVTPAPNLRITAEPDHLKIRPGERIEFKLAVERGPAFNGRVPIEVRNLPHGVRVLNIGLNGVLVTEQQTERSVFLYAEPWVQPQARPAFAVGKCEAAGTEHSAPPIDLEILPRR